MENLVENYLFTDNKIKIMQDPNMFSFSLDSLLVANFTKVNSNKSICDFGTNNGAIPMVLAAKGHTGKIVGLEIQERSADIARLNIKNNEFNNVEIITTDINDYIKDNKQSKFDLVISNPPYFKIDSSNSHLNDSVEKQIARHELKLSLAQNIYAASKVLENRGKFTIVHRAERADEIISLMRENKIMPKRLQFVYSKETSKEAITVLVEGAFQGNEGMKVLKPIIAHNEDGSYTDVIQKLFILEG